MYVGPDSSTIAASLWAYDATANNIHITSLGIEPSPTLSAPLLVTVATFAQMWFTTIVFVRVPA